MAADTNSPVRDLLWKDAIMRATYDYFKKWWEQYEADISSTPMTSTKGIAFDAWLAAIKLMEEKFTANNTQSAAIAQIAACIELCVSNVDNISWPDMCDTMREWARQLRAL